MKIGVVLGLLSGGWEPGGSAVLQTLQRLNPKTLHFGKIRTVRHRDKRTPPIRIPSKELLVSGGTSQPKTVNLKRLLTSAGRLRL